MKKLALLLLALLFITGFCFAQEEAEETDYEESQDFFCIEITMGVPVHWTNSPKSHDYFNQYEIDKTVTVDTAIGLALVFNFTKSFGITLDTDFFFGSDVMGESSTTSASTSLSGFNMFLGPVFYLYNGAYLRIPLGIGAHLYYWSSEVWVPDSGVVAGVMTPGAWYSTSDLQIGPSISLGIQFHFDRNIYILSRTSIALDMFRWHSVIMNDSVLGKQEHSDSEFALSWYVKPTIGAGIKF